MNRLKKLPIQQISKGFILDPDQYGFKDEFHFRNIQNQQAHDYRPLTAREIEVLVQNQNTAEDWNNIHVSPVFNPNLIRQCEFYGMVRIGNLDNCTLEYHDLRLPVGLYRSTILNCDIGDNVVISNVRYMSHYIVSDEVMLVNINELVTTSTAKFGNGIVKQGKEEGKRIYIELCNENGGRKILPFDSILPGDAYLWSRYRHDEELQKYFEKLTHQLFDDRPGYYGVIGSGCVIKNTLSIKDVHIGEGTYIKGANKIKNLTIHSTFESPSQIGEGCELVNGIIGVGCRVFYGVKAVRFILASHSQLKYGARLINSYLGNNSTISCCEVLNSLIFPGHEQHHNNSFLCASLVRGQSNMAAGATIGSNHNSRAADGELIAGRGFWPGLSVSLKHNSRFASFVLITKGSYPAELDISIPFSLVANDEHQDRLVIMPAYWFMHNMYALARNCSKARKRDQRLIHHQMLHYDFLEPDTVYELIRSIGNFEFWAGCQEMSSMEDEQTIRKVGRRLLQNPDTAGESGEIVVEGIERSNRKVVIRNMNRAYAIYRRLITYHLGNMIRKYLSEDSTHEIDDLLAQHTDTDRYLYWENVGGQLIPKTIVEDLKEDIKRGKVGSWEDIHEFYLSIADQYTFQKCVQAVAAYEKVFEVSLQDNPGQISNILQESIDVKEWMTTRIRESRQKDYQNSFRSMVYDSREEMEQVMGFLMKTVLSGKVKRNSADLPRKLRRYDSYWSFRKNRKQAIRPLVKILFKMTYNTMLVMVEINELTKFE